ncbi:MAG: EpsG family protein [Cyclobacteriaceae bacterium]|nr:EpsG family protein [Cyclobacteriaceae bacterium]
MKQGAIDNRNSVLKNGLFIFWPFVSLILSINKPWDKVFLRNLSLFFGFFGLLFIANDTSDTARYATYFQETGLRPFSDFYDIIFNLYATSDVKWDFFQKLIEFLVSRITDNVYIYFGVLSFILGYALKSLISLISFDAKNKNNTTAVMILLFLITLCLPLRMLSFRHYLASLVFVIAFFQYSKTKEIKYLIATLSVIFIHFGFFLLLPFLLLFVILGSRDYIYYGVIVLCFVYNDTVTSSLFVLNFEDDFALESTVKSYASEDYNSFKNEVINQTLSIITLLPVVLKWFIFSALIYVRYFVLFLTKSDRSLISFSLLFFAFLVLFGEISAVVDRFSITYSILGLVILFRVYSRHAISEPNLFFKIGGVVVFSWSIMVIGRQLMDYIPVFYLTPLPYLSLLDSAPQSIIEWIKN